MKQNRWIEVVGALCLIGAGALFLLQNMGLMAGVASLVWAVLFLGGGVLFLLGFAQDRSQWWPLIPGSGLVGIGLAILLGGTFSNLALQGGALSGVALFASLAAGFAGVYLVDRRANWWAVIPGGAMVTLAALVLLTSVIPGEWAGAVFFLGLGAIFAGLYFVEIDGRRNNWWALIPAGALLSLAVVVVLSALGADEAAGAALFFGLGLTFGALYLLRRPERPLDWAWIPSVALLGFGFVILALAGDALYARLFWPVALIIAGLVLFVVNLRRARGRFG